MHQPNHVLLTSFFLAACDNELHSFISALANRRIYLVSHVPCQCLSLNDHFRNSLNICSSLDKHSRCQQRLCLRHLLGRVGG